MPGASCDENLAFGLAFREKSEMAATEIFSRGAPAQSPVVGKR